MSSAHNSDIKLPQLSRTLDKNPFKIPTDEDILIIRDEQSRKNIEEREKFKGLKIYEKTTQTFKNSNINKTNLIDNDVQLGSSLDKDVSSSRLLKSHPIPKSSPSPPQALTASVAGSRTLFLMSYSLTVKRDEMLKLQARAMEREEALRKAEKMLEEDTARFDAFLKENNLKTMEATKRADAETKAKLDKFAEIKRLTLQIGTIKNEMAKYDEQLEDCKKYRDFLDKLAPNDVNLSSQQPDIHVNNGAGGADLSIHFTKPSQLLSIFKSLEESNMFLIQNSQETEKILEELHQSFKETAQKLEEETDNLKSQILSLEKAIEHEELSWTVLEEKALKNFGLVNSTTQSAVLQAMHQKTEEVYRATVREEGYRAPVKEEGYRAIIKEDNQGGEDRGEWGDRGDRGSRGDRVGSGAASDRAGSAEGPTTSTLAMLTSIEHYMDDLFKQQSTLPQSYLITAIKIKEKERRIKQRADKIEKQKIIQELRTKKSLERAQAPIKHKASKPIMFRSVLPKEIKKQEQSTINKQSREDEELHYFGLM